MSSAPASPGAEERLLARAREGEQAAFAELLQAHRTALHAHCYRMLGSVDDADEVLQETMLRAWRGLGRFQGRSSLRSWLYTIATNTCLDQIQQRARRILPVDLGPASPLGAPPGEPVVESVWIEPYPDEQLGSAGAMAVPEARYEAREAVELAFIAALQHLPGTQRAVLILREVLAFSAREVAEALQTSVASVNSALQRARATVAARVPERSQQATLRAIGEGSVRELVDRYLEAWERNDVEAFTSMLAAEASFAMPPLASWYRGREAIARWASDWSMSGAWRWRGLPTSACGQPALGFYAWSEQDGAFRPFALNVLSFQDERVSAVTAFIAREPEASSAEAYTRYPEEAPKPELVDAFFGRFGLPGQLP